MITSQVTYTVDPEFVAANKKLIAGFLEDFKSLKHLAFMYNVLVKQDGVTFVHISMYETEAVQQEISGRDSFKAFQEARDASGLKGEVVVEALDLIGSSLYLIPRILKP